jgi:hypothetical protein
MTRLAWLGADYIIRLEMEVCGTLQTVVYSTDCAVRNCRPVMHDTFSCKTKGVGPSMTLAWPGWKQPNIPVEVDLVVNSRMLL